MPLLRKRESGIVLIALICLSCTSQFVSPELDLPPTIAVLLKAPISFDGNKEYLPRTISEDVSPSSDFSVNYSYTELQERDDSKEVLALFNPLTLIGFPTGGIASTINARLNISKGNEVIKSYNAICKLKVTRTIFTDGDSFSELRKKGLIAVRNNIEAQMYKDQESLKRIAEGT
jgi:hypothetical protein